MRFEKRSPTIKAKYSVNISSPSSKLLATEKKISFNEITSTLASTNREAESTMNSLPNIKNLKFDKKKSLLIKKVSNEQEATKIKAEFEDASNYLRSDNNYSMVNIKTKSGPRFDSNNKIIPYSVVGSPTIFENQFSSLFKSTGKSYSKLITNMNQNVERKLKNCQTINNDEVKGLIDNVEKRVAKSEVNEFLSNVPIDLKRRIAKQENLFKIQKRKEIEEDGLSNRISKKSKKNLSQLLVNLNDSNKIKNEILDIVENKKRKLINYGTNEW
jgi:hypothetical protein